MCTIKSSGLSQDKILNIVSIIKALVKIVLDLLTVGDLYLLSNTVWRYLG